MADFSKFGVKGGRYNSTLPTLGDGDPVELQVDDRGRLIVVADVDVNVQLTHTGATPDSVQIGDGTDILAIAADGSIAVTDNGSSLTIDNSTLSVVGGGAEATALRVTLANDSTGVLTIDDGGSSITVDGSVTVSASDLDIRDLTHVSDSVQVGDGTEIIQVNADGSINVLTELDTDDLDTGAGTDTQAIVGLALAESGGHALVGSANPMPISDNGSSITVDGSVTVSASDLDIRDLTHVSDSVKVGDGTDFLAIAADGSIAVTDNGASLTIDNSTLSVVGGGTEATALRVTIANDSTGLVSVDDGGSTLSIDDGDGSITVDGSVTVSASDLDIRDLSHSQDSIKVGDGTDFLAINADGSINVQLDSTLGTEGDVGCDESGDGLVQPTNAAWTDIVSISVGAGVTYLLQGFDVFADEDMQFQIIVDDDGTPSKWIRRGLVNSAMPGYGNTFPRAIEISGGATISIKLQGKNLTAASSNAGGGLNGYTV